MKKKSIAQFRHRVASTRRISVAAFMSLRSLLAALICVVAACSLIAGALPAFFRPETQTKTSHPAAAGLTFAERVV
jgi:hypothetical protein